MTDDPRRILEALVSRIPEDSQPTSDDIRALVMELLRERSAGDLTRGAARDPLVLRP